MQTQNKKSHSTQKLTVFYNSDEISRRVVSLAQEIAEQMRTDNISGDKLIVISLLKGGFVFTADLIRALYSEGIHPQVDFMALSSYGTGKKSSGKVDVISDTRENFKGRHALIVDDILESGHTLAFVKSLLQKRGAKSVKTVVFLEKPGKREIEIESDFVGFMVPDKFVVGYGLDSAHNFRELPFIAVLGD